MKGIERDIQYDIIFVTNQPAFYKVRLWNEISKFKKVLLIFIDIMESDRNIDFVSVQPSFEYVVLPKGEVKGLCSLLCLLNKTKYRTLLIGGWDDIRLLVLPFLSSKRKNALLCESSYYEYHSSLIKDIVKKLILKRISIVFPSGKAQGRLFSHLGFYGEYRYTGGCGLLNYIDQPSYQPRSRVCSFLFVGRLVEEKNLKLLINVFNHLPEFQLTIIGFGEQEEELKAIAKENVSFLGAVENKRLNAYYQQADVFVLPSIYEPWGLVIEEALNNGIPVIVSDKVGCREDLVSDRTGLVFDSSSEKALYDAVIKMTDIDFYNHLRLQISYLDFKERAKQQVDIYL